MNLRPVIAMALCVAGAVVSGCGSGPKMTATQMDALQVREVEASYDRTFSAATGALIDAGYQVLVSDGDAGVLTAEMREDPAVAANVATVVAVAVLSFGHVYYDLPPKYHALCLQVMPVSAARSKVRIRTYVNAQTVNDQEKVREVWALMQRQVLLGPEGPGLAK